MGINQKTSKAKRLNAFLHLIFLMLLLGLVPLAYSEQQSLEDVKKDMDAVYGAFRDLQKYMSNKKVFSDPQNRSHINEILQTMNKRFHRVGLIAPKYSRDPGFISTIKTMNSMLADVRMRFAEGKSDYAFWRLQASSNYCVSCHTRYAVEFDFTGQGGDLKGLNSYEQGEFLMATRQFEKAAEAFLKAVNDPSLKLDRIVALYKWLVIYTRVHPDPKEAIKELKRVQDKVELPKSEEEEIDHWLDSLKRWEKEEKSSLQPLQHAAKLLNEGIKLNGTQAGTKGMVEILRATAILHAALADRNVDLGASGAQVYYQLGLAYSYLPELFVNELPEVFLEECIRTYPNTEYAHKAYQLLQDNISEEFTGSAGTRLPKEVAEKLKQLRKIAFAEGKSKKQTKKPSTEG